ncbi:hypothetical protein GCM10009796_18100 [Microbacterium koreense]
MQPSPEATNDRNESASPVAARSWATGLTGIGMSPTSIMCRPADAIDTRIHVDRRGPRAIALRSAPMTAPYAESSAPETMTVELKVRPEKSWCVPSWEKWSVHHVPSCVVTTASRTPVMRARVASAPNRWEAPGVAEGASGTTSVRAARVRRGMRGESSGGGVGDRRVIGHRR